MTALAARSNFMIKCPVINIESMLDYLNFTKIIKIV